MMERDPGTHCVRASTVRVLFCQGKKFRRSKFFRATISSLTKIRNVFAKVLNIYRNSNLTIEQVQVFFGREQPLAGIANTPIKHETTCVYGERTLRTDDNGGDPHIVARSRILFMPEIIALSQTQERDFLMMTCVKKNSRKSRESVSPAHGRRGGGTGKIDSERVRSARLSESRSDKSGRARSFWVYD